MIVSSGYLLGKVRTDQWKKRVKALLILQELFKDFDQELRSYRKTIQESFAEKGEIAKNVLSDIPISGLVEEDRMKLHTAILNIKNSSFRESVAANQDLLNYLEHTIKKLQEDTASSGKALPIVTGAIGLLIAVLLF